MPASDTGVLSSANAMFDELNGQCEQLISDRKLWDSLWDDAAKYIMPRKGQILTKTAPGEELTTAIYDTTANKANQVFAAGLVSHIVPAGEKWFQFRPKRANASIAFSDWLAECSDIVTDLIYSSNFYRGIHEDFLDAGCFCTSVMLMEEGKRYAYNFVNIPVGTFAVDEDAEGNVDTMVREWQWNARQAAQKWGADNLGRLLSNALRDPKQATKKFTFRHLVRPRENYRTGLAAPQARRFASYYLCVEDKQVLEEGGYYEFPYLVSRLLRSNNEKYGRGPGVDTLPDIRMLNSMERDLITAVQKAVFPPWLAPEDSSYVPDNRPNGVTYWDTSNPANKPEQLDFKGRIDLGEQKTEQKRELIRESFFNPMFQLLTTLDEQKREKTAYEVQQMVAEKLVLFSPLFARMCEEKLNPMLERAFGIAARRGFLPPPPQSAPQEMQYEIVYTSKIALAIKAAENQSFATMIQLCTEMAQLDPSVVDVVKWRDGFRRIARNVALPPRLLRTDAEVDAIQRQKQQAAQQQQASEQMRMASETAKNLGPKAQQDAHEKMREAAEGMS